MPSTMKIESEFVEQLSSVHPRDLIEILQSEDRPHFDNHWKIFNEIKPGDLYCYLYGRFGPPNGIQNFLRGDHSENLIHWEWALASQGRIILVQGHNFRTEIWVSGDDLGAEALDQLVVCVKDDFPKHGQAMGKVRKTLEHWVEFINPYHRIRSSVECLMSEIEALDVEEKTSQLGGFGEYESPEQWANEWERQAEIVAKATGLCFGARAMLPVMAEAFVNLLMYLLMKPNLKQDDRLRENLIRQPIDVRIKSLAHNCVGFQSEIDYSHESCRRYHSMVNERNDLLHGNVVIEKLRFNELHFNGRVPVFGSYASMWERAFGVAKRSVGLEVLRDERQVVEGFVEYVISRLNEKRQEQVRIFCARRDLGICLDDGRLGVLFSGQLVDMAPGPRVRG
ncbi:hypothetical protein H8Z72_00790 [Xanthomonas citri pv. citri]|uniref:Uncharacterized protein n=4 Tax=Xanthomonas TaxID=338 RepID=A0AAI7ZCF2_XANAC|nr:hypothetical protein XAC0149 [Xanthomonas citri pv. citri str. 306]AGI06362.1 Hypothetical Protein XCAW_00543 [Xanthomonas citri subsp. citri Aw12879]AJD66738.1 hypothetical protein J151_00266 [Xanthomonas citri subsp. citri A306]AJY80273.1 hypothetical protein J159_00264 [Xanthomonas citri pv. citri]AJY84695.1 hypothetical protein J158_00264 [Xanthomonas citri subsp. citri UI6]OOX22290.1 hypothetical protein Xcaj_19825 [Xanthomonas axonopodis pv. cajani]QOX03122.1 hypothetical protein IG6